MNAHEWANSIEFSPLRRPENEKIHKLCVQRLELKDALWWTWIRVTSEAFKRLVNSRSKAF